MISAAAQYSGLGIILGLLLVTAVVVLFEKRDHNPDRDAAPRRRRCNHPTITRKDH